MIRSLSRAARRRISLIARVPHSICIPSYTPSIFSFGEQTVKVNVWRRDHRITAERRRHKWATMHNPSRILSRSQWSMSGGPRSAVGRRVGAQPPVRDPLPSSVETENVHAVRGGVQENGFCTKRYSSVISPFNRWYITPLQDGNSEHFSKGRVPVCWYNASYGLVQVGRCEDRSAGTTGLLQRYILRRGPEGPKSCETERREGAGGAGDRLPGVAGRDAAHIPHEGYHTWCTL